MASTSSTKINVGWLRAASSKTALMNLSRLLMKGRGRYQDRPTSRTLPRTSDLFVPDLSRRKSLGWPLPVLGR